MLTLIPTNIGTTAAEDMVSIYPNPAGNSISIAMSYSTSTTNLQLINELGQVVAEEQYSDANHAMNISGISRGLYMIRIKRDDVTLYRKVLKN